MTLDAIKHRLQEYLRDGLVTIVGSGLSCAEGLPSMQELACYLSADLGPKLSPLDAELWEKIEPLLESGLESALLGEALSTTLEAAISRAIASLIAARELQVISDVFNGKRKLRLTRLLAHLLKPSNGLPIITTNYDRLVEIAVEEAGIGVDTMFVGRFAANLNERGSTLSFCDNVSLRKKRVKYHYRPRALVYKPHGSLDWYLRDGRPVSYSGELNDVPRLIITPGQNKFRNGYESPFDLHRSKANKEIDQARQFLILGYGFNDDHLETHLTPAISSGKSTLMLTKTLSQNAERLAMAHGNIITLESAEENDVSGTRIIIKKTPQFIPNLHIWDVHQFIDEVLEP